MDVQKRVVLGAMTNCGGIKMQDKTNKRLFNLVLLLGVVFLFVVWYGSKAIKPAPTAVVETVQPIGDAAIVAPVSAEVAVDDLDPAKVKRDNLLSQLGFDGKRGYAIKVNYITNRINLVSQ